MSAHARARPRGGRVRTRTGAGDTCKRPDYSIENHCDCREYIVYRGGVNACKYPQTPVNASTIYNRLQPFTAIYRGAVNGKNTGITGKYIYIYSLFTAFQDPSRARARVSQLETRKESR